MHFGTNMCSGYLSWDENGNWDMDGIIRFLDDDCFLTSLHDLMLIRFIFQKDNYSSWIGRIQ